MRHLLIAALSVMLTLPVAALDLQKGLEAVQRGDYAAALREWRPLAEQGDAMAQYNLGLVYAKGQGVAQDYGEAVKWYRKAAEQGNAMAQSALGFMYGTGKGVAQDYVQAHVWANLAVSKLPPGEVRGKAKKKRDDYEKRMTAEDILKAQRLARAWRPRPVGVRSSGAGVTSGSGRAKRVSPTNPGMVRRIQSGLASLGYDPGPADGIPGPRTRTAIRAFQDRQGLPVTGEVSASLDAALEAHRRSARVQERKIPRQSAKQSPKMSSTGSGFYVSTQGHILTNAHVVEGCKEVRLPRSSPAGILAQDKASDLSLLKDPSGTADAVAVFRGGRGIRAGDDVIVVGYPLRGLLASEANVTTGSVSALAGPADDRRLFQVTAPVQAGNSGGPVLDKAGNVVGVVVSKLNAIRIARATGDIPQNVNFAIV